MPRTTDNNAKVVQFRRGTSMQHQTFAGAQGELTVDTDKNTVVVHDGYTIGGFPLEVEGVEHVRTRYLTFRAAIVQQGIASLGFTSPENSPVPIAYTEASGLITGVARFAKNVSQSIQDHFMLPDDWVGPIDLDIIWRTDSNFGTIGWSLETANVPLGTILENVGFNPVQHFGTTHVGIPQTLQTARVRLQDTFTAGSELFFRLTRDIYALDTIDADVDMLSMRFTIRIKGK